MATQQCNLSPYVYAVYWLSQPALRFNWPELKMQLTGLENGNNMRSATYADTQILNEWPYCSFLYCGPD